MRRIFISAPSGKFNNIQAGKLAALATVFIAAFFSLAALAADSAAANAPDGTLSFQKRLERMKTMTPEQQKQERDLMRQELEKMTPAQRAEQRQEIRAHWEQMSPEERAQVRARMQEHWKSMPPEQREERRKEMREHFKNMSPEERQQFKSDMNMIDGMPPDNIGSTAGSAAGATR